MSEKLIQELEEILIPHALERYNYNDVIGGKIIGTLFKGAITTAKQYLVWIVRAVIRCIIEAEENIYLADITTAAMSEAYVLMNFTPMKNNFRTNLEVLASNKVLLESEIHQWLLFLDGLEKLPGRYNRFTGQYKIKF